MEAAMDDLRDRLAELADRAAREARGPGAAVTLRRAQARRRWAAGSRVALSLLLVLGLGLLTSRLLADREGPAQITTPPPGATPRQAAPLWTAEAAAPRPVEPWERGPRAAGALVVAASGHQQPGRVRAYDARTGRLVWTYRSGPNAFIRAVGSGWVIVGADFGPLIGLDLATGTERWRFALASLQAAGEGTIAGDTLVIGTSFPTEGAVDPPVLYALELATGRQRWRTPLDRGTDLQWAAPLLDGGKVLVADTPSHQASAPTSHLHALDTATGKLRWKADLHTSQQGFFAEPPVLAGGLVYVATAARRLLALEAGSGREVWAARGFPLVAGVRDGLVLAALEDRLVALDAASGTRRWQLPIGGRGERWPVLDGASVYLASADEVLAVDAATGTRRWRLPAGPAVGPPVRVGQRLYVATRSRLLALDTATGRPVWTSPKARITHGPLATPGGVVVATTDGTLLGFAP
jgi:outer membrane protein assembly factor BamB